MIEVGDLVRIKSKHLAASNVLGLFSRHSKRKPFGRKRGKVIIARVVSIPHESYDWRSRKTYRQIELDVPDPHARLWGHGRNWVLDSTWLVVHRKGNKNGPRNNC